MSNCELYEYELDVFCAYSLCIHCMLCNIVMLLFVFVPDFQFAALEDSLFNQHRDSFMRDFLSVPPCDADKRLCTLFNQLSSISPVGK